MALDTRSIPQDLSPADGTDKQLQAGTLLVNRYMIQDVIGIGGMGSVYRARDMHFPSVTKLVAVKEMISQTTDPSTRRTMQQNFEREANILVTLTHPSIPKIFDFFTYEERSYLVLEFIDGSDLEAYLAESQSFFPEDKVIGWAIELCDVLSYLHNYKPEPVIFRDMKPSNVMVNKQNHIVLVDFGIAKVFRTGQKGTMIGTEGYSPPEQYRGEAAPMVDIYALGATLHHLLTRRDPRLEAPFTFNERPIRKINSAISPELEIVVSKALDYEPQNRFKTAAEMKQALLAAAEKTGVLGRLPALISSDENESEIKPLWTFNCEDEIRGTPCYHLGSIYVGAYDNNLYAVNASNGKFLWKYPTEGGIVSQPTIADGKIIFGSEDHKIYALSVQSGHLAWEVHTNGPVRGSARVAEGHALIGSDDGFLYAVNLNSNNVAWKMDAGESVRSSPFIGTDFVYVGCESGEFFCADFRGDIKWRFKAKRAVTSSPLGIQSMVVFAGLDGTLYALDAKTGWVIWRFRMGKGSVSSPCRGENWVYVGSADGYLYSLDASNGRENWRFRTEHQVSGSPIFHKDNIYFGSTDGFVYCLEFRTGRLRWKFNSKAPITGSPIVYNDVLYIGSTNHSLYALVA